MCLGAYRAVGRVANKLAGQVRDRLSTTDAVVVQEAIVRRTEADGTMGVWTAGGPPICPNLHRNKFKQNNPQTAVGQTQET